jgi:mannosyltransferase
VCGRPVLALAAILALAAVLRGYLIGAQSLWADEMSSLVTAVKPIPQLLYDISNEIHPPLYHLTLKVWIALFGTSEAGIRSLSAVFGLVLVVLTYALGARLLGRRVGLLAAALSAISPFQVYYSQETRMYMPLAAFSALALYATVRFMECDGGVRHCGQAWSGLWLWGAVYVVANGLSLWLHYSYPIILVMENVVFGLWWLLTLRRGNWWLRGARWAGLQLLALAIYLPWLPIGLRQVSGWPSISESHGLSFILQEAFRLFALGESADARTSLPIVITFAVIFLVGLWPVVHRTTSAGEVEDSSDRAFSLAGYALLLCYALFPIFMMYGLSLLRPAYRPKFFLVGSAGFSLVLARGILGPWLRRGRWCRIATGVWIAAALIFVVGACGVSLRNYYFVPRFARDDYRGIAHYIEAVGKTGDAVLLNAPGQKDVFGYYYHGDLPVYPLPRQRPVNAGQTVQELETISSANRRLFAVFWATEESDPARVVEGWLDEHAYKALDSWRGNVRLVVYSLPAVRSSRDIQHPLDTVLGDRVALLGYTLPTEAVRAGDVMQLTLFWKALAPLPARYRVFVHLLDADNHIVGQRDAEPGGGVRLTTTWKPDEIIVDNYGIVIRPGTPPGPYRVELGLYAVDGGQRLPVTRGSDLGADHVLLPAVQVELPESALPVEALGIRTPWVKDLGALQLLGYDLFRLGHEHEDEQTFHAGDVAHVNLYWKRVGVLPDVTLTLQALDARGAVRTEQRLPIGGSSHPTSTWQLGEVVRDQYDVSLGGLSAGNYRLKLILTTAGGPSLPEIVLDGFSLQ